MDSVQIYSKPYDRLKTLLMNRKTTISKGWVKIYLRQSLFIASWLQPLSIPCTETQISIGFDDIFILKLEEGAGDIPSPIPGLK